MRVPAGPARRLSREHHVLEVLALCRRKHQFSEVHVRAFYGMEASGFHDYDAEQNAA